MKWNINFQYCYLFRPIFLELLVLLVLRPIIGCVLKVVFLLVYLWRCTKENRAAGILDNHAEGEKYKENFLRKYVRGKHPEIMPGLNKFFTDPTYWTTIFLKTFLNCFLELGFWLNLSVSLLINLICHVTLPAKWLLHYAGGLCCRF